MGYPMASNLFKKLGPKQFYIYDTSEAVMSDFSKTHSVQIAKNLVDLAKKCDAIFTMLPACPQVKEVYLGENGLVKGLKENTILFDSSTIAPSTSKEVAAALKNSCRAFYLDAPVSGGTLGAQAGTLTFMVGSENKEHFEVAKNYLQHMGKNITFCGNTGTGQIAKICNNMLLGISMVGASEAMNLGVNMGMDPKLLASFWVVFLRWELFQMLVKFIN